MKPTELTTLPLEDSIPLLRKLGVLELKLDNFHLILKDSPIVEDQPKAPVPPPLECICGHDLTEHNLQGECLHGCEKCAPKVIKQKE